MERLTRLLGIGLLVALAVLSITNFQETLAAVDDTMATRDESTPESSQAEVADGLDEPPAYLTFTAGLSSGFYAVGELPDEDDSESDDEDADESDSESDAESDRESDADIDDGDQSDGDDPAEELESNPSLNEDGEIVPGLYATAFDVEECSFELRRIMRDDNEAVIGSDRLDRGRMLVSINEIEPDTFRAARECGEWMPWSPLVEPLTVAGNGDYWIGDLRRGVWNVPEGCMWEKVVGFRGAKLWDVQDSGFGPDQPLVIDEETVGVRIRGCGSDFVHSSLS